MLSVIICTAQLLKIDDINSNISETVGVEYELIIIDNSESKYNIFQAYNIGVQRSRFPFLCFMHDDIVYHSKDWGQAVLAHFQSEKIGMIGVGGTRFLSNIPTIWWAGGEKYADRPNSPLCINCIQTNKENPTNRKHTYINPENSASTKVAVLDGLWFCIKKDLFDTIRFDEISYTGFHFYDLDISMQVCKSNYEIHCIFDIKLEHISASKHDVIWLQNCYIFYKKWKSELPVLYTKLSLLQTLDIETKALLYFRQITKRTSQTSFSDFKKAIKFSNLVKFHIHQLFS